MEKVDAIYDELIKECKLPEDSFFQDVEDPILQSVFNYQTVEQAVQQIKKRLDELKVEPKLQVKIFRTLFKKIYWPVRDLFGDELTVFLKKINVDTSGWPLDHVLFRPVSYSGVASEVINELGMHSVEQEVRSGLRNLVEKYQTGEWIRGQAMEMLQRLPEFGGLGFDAERSEQIMGIIDRLRKTVEILSEEAYATALTKSVPLGRTKADKDAEEDAEEISTIRRAMPESPKIVTELDKAIEETWKQIEEKPEDEYLERRLKNIISSRLRDIRKPEDVVTLLQRDSKVGGLDLDRDVAQILARTIEDAYQTFRKPIEDEQRRKLELQTAEQKRKIEERRQREAEEHAKWYREKVQSRERIEGKQKELAAALKQAVTTHPADQKEALRDQKRFGKMVPAPIPAKTGKPAIKVSAVSAGLSGTVVKKVDGVQSVPQLRGLAGELGSLTLAQFRRLGKTPKDATEGILRRLETLESEGPEKRIGGIRGWQGSPVMKEYFTLVAESFKSGKPIAEIAETKRAEGKDSLSKEEIQALIELNNRLHF